MSARTGLAGIAVALVVTTGASQVAHAEPLRIGYVTWVGNGPLFVARDKGLFAKEGIEVELINMAISEANFAGLFAGQVDVVSVTIDSMLPHFDPQDPYVCFLALDESRGGDGIVANKEIRSIADLKGKIVAFPKGTVSEFYLNVLLKRVGLSEADIEPVEMTFDDAADAFLMQEVDAAVTAEPWLRYGRQSEHGHVLADSSATPGLIVDCLVAKASVFDKRLGDFRAMARAWDAGLAYVEAHPEESNEIMARSVGGWLEDPAVFAETLKGVRFYDEQRNRKYFGTSEHPGQIYDTAQTIIDVWTSLGGLKAHIAPTEIIAHGVWDE